jgi:hypothetical protein
MVQDDGPVGLDGVAAVFGDERAVANAGIALVVTLAARLGIEALVDRFVGLGARSGAANAGRKVMTLLYAMALGADSIDDCDILRSGVPVRCSAGRSPRRRRWGRFCGRSRSGTCASSIGCWARRSDARGRRAPGRTRGGS